MKKLSLLVLMLALLLVIAGCDDTTKSSSVGDASLVFGLELDESTLEIPNPNTVFPVMQDIYYVFTNNAPFGNNQLTIQLLDTSNNEVLLEQPYEVNPENGVYANIIGFNNPGKYKVLLIIDGKTRAQQELIIE